MNYDGLFLGRIDYQDKEFRHSRKSAEMIWHASENLGEKADLFTSILYDGYDSPKGFCFDVKCWAEPLIDDKNSPEYNMDGKVRKYKDKYSNACLFASENV